LGAVAPSLIPAAQADVCLMHERGWVGVCEWGVPAAGTGPRAAATPHRRGGRVDLALRRRLDSTPEGARSRLLQKASSPEQRIPLRVVYAPDSLATTSAHRPTDSFSCPADPLWYRR